MKQLSTISIIFSAFLLCACQRDTHVTGEFKNYLKTVWDTVPRNGVFYLIVPATLCKNCVQLDAKNMAPEFRNRIRVISVLKQTHFKNFPHFKYDSNEQLEHLRLLDYEPKLVMYDRDQVLLVRSVNVSRFAGQTPSFCDPE